MTKRIVGLLFVIGIVLPANGYGATVNVAVPSFSMSLVAFMAAKERGYYRQEGLDVNFVLARGDCEPRLDCGQRGLCHGGRFRSHGLSRRRSVAAAFQLL